MFQEQQHLHYSGSWNKLDSYPPKFGRTDDLFFFNREKGFVINSQGLLFLTVDGGASWEQKFQKERTFFRCLTFKDSLNGWLGTLGPDDASLFSADSIAMYESHDGGESWNPAKFQGPYPKGLCGLQTVSDNVIVGCGRVRGPSYFIKTVDGGKTWQSYNYNHIAGSLIAPHFYDENHGILIGGTTTDKVECRSLVLETFDGGTTWDTLYISDQKGEYCWKVSFPTKNRGFISIQRNVQDGQFYILQTEDGGKTWSEKVYIEEPYYVQGIGFLNNNVGWMGGSNKWTMETRDGGKTWLRMADVGKGFNKFQFFDELAYGVGFGVYKMEELRPLKNGLVNEFDESGNLKSAVYYRNGVQWGKVKHFDEKGRVVSSGRMKKNLQHGKWKIEDKSGKVDILKYRYGRAKVSESLLKSYTGKYQVEEKVYRTIFYRDGSLYSNISTSESTFEIIPISDVEFVYDFDLNTRVEFVRNTGGKVTHHIMKNRSGEKMAKKIPSSN